MFVNYKIGLAEITGDTYVNIPINLQYQIVDNGELVERVFVEKETQKAVNPILDYDKVKFKPFNNNNQPLLTITYNLIFLDSTNTLKIPTHFSDIGFTSNDINKRYKSFTESFLKLEFYDSDNPMVQNLLFEVLIYNTLNAGDFYPKNTQKPNIPGQPIPANNIETKMVLSNPEYVSIGKYEGIYLYDYKDEYPIGSAPKDLYMKATYNNAKTGKIINLVSEKNKLTIDKLVKNLYTKYTLYRDASNFCYRVDNTYSNNVSYIKKSNTNIPNSDILINLYQIQAL